MSEKENKISVKVIILTICSLLAVIIMVVSGYFYVINTQQKAPLDRIVKLKDTDLYIATSYNNKYGIARLDITIDETIEDWQIKAIGNNLTYIKLECETKDRTIKKDYEFPNVELNKGEKIKGSLILENFSQKDYVMLKDLLSGEVKIENSEYLSLDTKERDRLQQEYYKKEQKKSAKPKSAPARRMSSPSFFDTLFDF